jgi:hypothetical protein
VLQEVLLLEEFYDKRLLTTSNLPINIFEKNPIFFKKWSNIVPNYFKYLNMSTFKSFFQQHQVDIPTLFKYSKSLYRPSNEIFLIKFNNYISREGKSLKNLRIFNLVLWNFFFKSTNLLFTILPYNLLNDISKIKFLIDSSLYYYSGYYQNLIQSDFFVKTHNYTEATVEIYKTLKRFKPIFAFYIYKIDKNIYKNTRGKSGKFTFLWKYVAPYKRMFVSLSWLAKELRTKTGQTFSKRMYTLMTHILFDPKILWPHKIKQFSHNYVYKNCRKTLAESYITSKN